MKSFNISYRFLKSIVSLACLFSLLISCNSKNETELTRKESIRMTNSDESKVHQIVEKMPYFPGGDEKLMKFISMNVNYPSEAIENRVEGRVICKFIVKKDGSIDNIEVVRGIHESLDNEAIRVIKLFPKWIPGEQDGEPVNVLYTLPILFRLQ